MVKWWISNGWILPSGESVREGSVTNLATQSSLFWLHVYFLRHFKPDSISVPRFILWLTALCRKEGHEPFLRKFDAHSPSWRGRVDLVRQRRGKPRSDRSGSRRLMAWQAIAPALLHSALHSADIALYTVHCVLCTVQCAVCSDHSVCVTVCGQSQWLMY